MSMRSVRVVRTRLAPRRFVVNLFGVLLTRDKTMLTPTLINHELIHTAQMRELGYVGFYILYGLEWLWHLLRTFNWYKAYRALSFEREAYIHGADLTYLGHRRRFAQWRGSNGR